MFVSIGYLEFKIIVMKRILLLFFIVAFSSFNVFCAGGNSCATATTWNFTDKTFSSDIAQSGTSANSLWYTFDATTVDNYVVLWGDNNFTYKLWKGTCGALTQVYSTVATTGGALTWVKYIGGTPLVAGTTYYIELIFTVNTSYSGGVANDPYSYTGFYNTDATDSRNYANTTVPTATDDVKIPIASWVTINLSTNPAIVRTITIEKGVTLPITSSDTYTAITNNGTIDISTVNSVLTTTNMYCNTAPAQINALNSGCDVNITSTLTIQNGGNLTFSPNGTNISNIDIGTLQVNNGGVVDFKDYVKFRVSGDVTIDGTLQLEYANASGNPSVGGSFTINGALNHQGHRYIMLTGTGKTLGGTGSFYGGRTAPIQISGDNTVTGASYTLTDNIRLTHFFVGDGDGGGEIDGTFSLGTNTLRTCYFIQEGTFNQNSGTLQIEGPTTFVQSGGFFNGITWTQPDFATSGVGGTINPFFTTVDKFDEGTGVTYIGSGEYGITDDVYQVANSQTVPSITYYNLKVRTNNGFIATVGTGADFQVSNNCIILNPSVAGGIVSTANNIDIRGNINIGHNGISSSGNGLIFNVVHRVYRGVGTGVLNMGNNTSHVINITYLDANGAGDEVFTGFGSLTFYGDVYYKGAGSQEIIGYSFYKLNINHSVDGSGTKELLGDIVVSNELKIWFGTLSATDGATARNITLQGDFTNLGAFTASTGKVICSGTAAQIIQGNQTSFYNFEINKSANSVTEISTNGIVITNNIDFTAGDLVPNLSGSPVIFETTSSITTAPSNSSHINGYVAKNHNSITEFTRMIVKT